MSEQPKKVKLTINDKPVEVAATSSVFQAASEAGVFVPHYCYHPDLSIAGVCRMCTVEIEKNPRLQISCNTQVAEGMVVRTDTPRVKEAVKSCLELHLINHPLDCPICDKAGECKLQDFYKEFGLYQSRMEYEKVHKPKATDIGTIMLDSERCILCTRCVRFTAEVTKTNELGIFNRGDRSELSTYDHKPLRNDYTGNLADICPVGALTAKDFRFECRVWFLEKSASTCTLCARGCNTTVSVNPTTKTLYRVEPRRNPAVNSSWICDEGRWDYHFVQNETRLKVPFRRVDGKRMEYTWDQGFKTLKAEITKSPQRVLVALSTQLTNEELTEAVPGLKRLGIEHFTWIVDEAVVDEKTPYDGILRHKDRTANAAGLEATMSALGAAWSRQKVMLPKVEKGEFDLVLCLGLESDRLEWVPPFLAAIPAQTRVALHVTTELPFLERAEWIFPNVSSFEKTGTVVNALGMAQKVKAALPRQFTSRDLRAFVFGLERGDDRMPWKEPVEKYVRAEREVAR